MANYRRQHYLPCVYLKNFSADGAYATRCSKIWSFDAKGSACVPVETVGFGNYMFSKSDPAASEAEFRSVEDKYGEAIKKIWNDARPTMGEYFALIYAAFDFHVRNLAHENKTGAEGIVAYRDRMTTFLNRLIVGHELHRPLSLQEMAAKLLETWAVRLLRSPGPLLITSDNPALCFAWRKAARASFVVFPVTSEVCAVVYDKRQSEVLGDSLTDSDGSVLIDLAARYCNRCVFTTYEPRAELKESCLNIWATRKRDRSITGDNQWNTYLIIPSQEDMFSFLRPIR